MNEERNKNRKHRIATDANVEMNIPFGRQIEVLILPARMGIKRCNFLRAIHLNKLHEFDCLTEIKLTKDRVNYSFSIWANDRLTATNEPSQPKPIALTSMVSVTHSPGIESLN